MNIDSDAKRESVKKDYDAIADAYAKDFGKEYEDVEIINKFLRMLSENSKVLDLGGGTGKITDLLIKNGHETICLDFSKEMQRKAKEYFGDIPYIVDDMLNIKNHFEDNSLDGIIAFYSIFHIPAEDLNKLFSDMNSVLKENGILCFSVQLGNGECFVDEPYLKEAGNKVLYMNFFTTELINSLLKNNGFEKVFESTKDEVGENELGDNKNSKIFTIAKKRGVRDEE